MRFLSIEKYFYFINFISESTVMIPKLMLDEFAL